jgi:hypothetical protein
MKCCKVNFIIENGNLPTSSLTKKQRENGLKHERFGLLSKLRTLLSINLHMMGVHGEFTYYPPVRTPHHVQYCLGWSWGGGGRGPCRESKVTWNFRLRCVDYLKKFIYLLVHSFFLILSPAFCCLSFLSQLLNKQRGPGYSEFWRTIDKVHKDRCLQLSAIVHSCPQQSIAVHGCLVSIKINVLYLVTASKIFVGLQ